MVEQAPRPPLPPLSMQSASLNGLSAGVVDFCLQLPPSKNQPCLVVEFLLACDAVTTVVITGRFTAIAQVSEEGVDPLVRCHGGRPSS